MNASWKRCAAIAWMTAALPAVAGEPRKSPLPSSCTVIKAVLSAELTEKQVAGAFRDEAVEQSPGRVRLRGVADFIFRTEQGEKLRELVITTAGVAVVPDNGRLALFVRGKASSAKALFDAMRSWSDDAGEPRAITPPGVVRRGSGPLQCDRTQNNNVERVESYLCQLRGVELVTIEQGVCGD